MVASVAVVELGRMLAVVECGRRRHERQAVGQMVSSTTWTRLYVFETRGRAMQRIVRVRTR